VQQEVQYAIKHKFATKIESMFNAKQTHLKGKKYLVKHKGCHHKEATPMKFAHLNQGENTLKVNHFSPKKVMYNEYYNIQQAKILMLSFDHLKHKQKKLQNLHDNILELKVQFELKLILIQQLDEKDWIKLMYIQYITYIFSTTIRPHVCGS
jgi:hypothetical protein